MLVHYRDLLDDLVGEMQRVANGLGIDIENKRVEQLAPAATFESMRTHAESLAPDPSGVLKDKSAFFRSGRTGSGIGMLDASDVAAYNERAAACAPADLLGWLHRA
jgi:hypothetical protein